MERLELPPRLRGGWDQALFVTYGANLAFFESALYREISSARNVIILADNQRLLESLSLQVGHRTATAINQSYLVSGVRSERAMHAKAILLTSEDQARLLVGSGNLSLQGYASGGELFTQYEFAEDDDQPAAAFREFWSFIVGLKEAGLLEDAAMNYLSVFADRAPWLYQAELGESSVWHNLEEPLIDQLGSQLGGESVEEVWALAPFHDEPGVALTELVNRFRPSRLHVLVQPRRTSANPTVLQRLVDDGLATIHAVGEGHGDPYLHAKLLLLKTASRSVCLQGSANLSQVALLRSAANGNVELANISFGTRDRFDYLVDELKPREERDIEALDIVIQPISPADIGGDAGLQLIGATLRGRSLSIEIKQPVLSTRSVEVLVDNEAAASVELAELSVRHSFDLPTDLIARLGGSRAVSLRVITATGEVLISNHVFPALLDVLDRKLQGSARTAEVDRVGDLDIDDEELEELLRQLNSLLMLDQQSVWQAAGRRRTRGISDDAEGDRIDYEDIDYELLREHPKFRQYRGEPHGESLSPLPVQAILRSIVSHFGRYLETTTGSFMTAGLEQEQSDVAEEREEEDRERQRHRWSRDQRLRRIVDNFLQRYLRGLASPPFQEIAGPEVMAQNFVIFNHLLWRLYAKEWADAEVVAKACSDMWSLFWGTGEEPGYWAGLPAEDTVVAAKWIEDHHTVPVAIASIYYGFAAASAAHDDDLTVSLRDVWRFALGHGLITPDDETIGSVSSMLAGLLPYDPPGPSAVAGELARLANYDTRQRFLAWVAQEARCTGMPVIERPTVHRANRGDSIVNCLVLPGARLDRELGQAIVGHWMRVESLDYYRIKATAGGLIFFDVDAGHGICRIRGYGTFELDDIARAEYAWDSAADQLLAMAVGSDVEEVA